MSRVLQRANLVSQTLLTKTNLSRRLKLDQGVAKGVDDPDPFGAPVFPSGFGFVEVDVAVDVEARAVKTVEEAQSPRAAVGEVLAGMRAGRGCMAQEDVDPVPPPPPAGGQAGPPREEAELSRALFVLPLRPSVVAGYPTPTGDEEIPQSNQPPVCPNHPAGQSQVAEVVLDALLAVVSLNVEDWNLDLSGHELEIVPRQIACGQDQIKRRKIGREALAVDPGVNLVGKSEDAHGLVQSCSTFAQFVQSLLC
jgi:hypothetical protein